MTDQAITRAIHEALRQDPRVDGSSISVTVEIREAALSGTVENLRAKQAAEETAGNVVGVWNVENELQVRPVSRLSDEMIRSKIRRRFLFDSELAGEEITVTSESGKVGLYGSVADIYNRDRAEEVAASVEGVISIANNILVPPRERPAPESDWKIRRNVESELFWSPYVDSENVNVIVSEGTVTLTGAVDTQHERQAAEDNAYEGGAIAVDNKLRIREGGN